MVLQLKAGITNSDFLQKNPPLDLPSKDSLPGEKQQFLDQTYNDKNVVFVYHPVDLEDEFVIMGPASGGDNELCNLVSLLHTQLREDAKKCCF